MLSFIQVLPATALPIFLFVTLVEYWSRRRGRHGEFSRKVIHMTVGTFAAFWPWYVSWQNIELLGAGALILLLISRYFGIYKSMHTARTSGMGEFAAALAMAVTPLITHSRWEFAIAMLQVSLADGAAALLGIRCGKRTSYKVLGATKSLVGTGTFMVISYSLLLSYSAFVWPIGVGWCLLLAIIATVVENLAVRGLDNLLLPILIAGALRLVAA